MDTKICSKCGPPAQPIENFALRSKAKGTRSPFCKPCQNKYGRQHYQTYKDKYLAKAHRRTRQMRQAGREYVLAYLQSHPCVDCGESDPVVLEFDHQHGKIDSVGNLIRAGVNLDFVKAEIEKCEVVCSNCHKRRTARAYNWYKALATR